MGCCGVGEGCVIVSCQLFEVAVGETEDGDWALRV